MRGQVLNINQLGAKENGERERKEGVRRGGNLPEDMLKLKARSGSRKMR